MILVLAQTGQMCNRLTTLIAAYALAIKYGESVCCPIVCNKLRENFGFDESASSVKTRMFNIPYLDKALWWVYLVLRMTHIYRFIPKQYNERRRHKLQIFIDAFAHLQDTAVIENLPACQRYFAFKPEIEAKCREMMATYAGGAKKLVAMHARRGDYKKFQDGRYYYTDKELLAWMLPLNEEGVRFVFFSNEKIDLPFYQQAGLDVVQSRGNDVEDLCCMSMCDYIMGPPSTFSWWAMVMGHKPRLELYRELNHCSFDSFRRYEDGITEVV